MRVPISCLSSLGFVVVACWTLAAAAPTAAGAADGKGYTLTVAAGEFDRRYTAVPFTLPDGAPASGSWGLTPTDAATPPAPVQVDGTRGVLIVRNLKAGQTATYTLHPATPRAAAPAPAVTAAREGGAVVVKLRDREVLRYQGEKTPLPEGYEPQFQRGGYVHPVLTPGGRPVTDDYPPNHKHHHGIWAPWTKTTFEGRDVDFWNMKEKKGTVEFVSLGNVTPGGDVYAGFRATHRFVDLVNKPDPKPVLNEEWDVRAYRFGAGEAFDVPYHLFDWQSTQTCATDSPLVLPQYHYGGLGFRGHRQWDGGKDKCRYLTSEGKTRANGNETRARWCIVSGDIDGVPASVVILGSPDNFRAPQPVRLHPTEPFFCFVPQQLGEFKIEPGKPYVARYRFAVYDGNVKAEEAERLWNDYAKPPAVTVR